MLLVIGDSHSVIWSGRLVEREARQESRIPQVKVHHIGAPLAYNLMGDAGNPGKWGKEVLALVATSDTATSVMLCFGEIDVRTQVVRRAIAGGLTLRQSAERVADRYVAFLDILRQETSLPVFVWGTIASAKDFGTWGTEHPDCGSELERNTAARLFNDRLSSLCRTRDGVFFLDILDRMLTPTLRTKGHLLDDGIHIGLRGLEYAIEAFRDVIAENGLDLPDYFRPEPIDDRKAGLRDISNTVRFYKMSSNFGPTPPRGISKRDAAGRYIFHTKQDDRPSVILDLGFGALVQRVSIWNRIDGFRERASTLEILVGNDPEAMLSVYIHAGSSFEKLEIELGHMGPFRLMECRLHAKEYFHLGGIEIRAHSFL